MKYLECAPGVCILNLEHLHGPKAVSYGKEELIVVCLVRNGLPWLKPFIEHYFSLGAKHIVFLDNDSTDDTVSAACRYDNVTILRSGLPFDAFGGLAQVVMRQYLISRFGKDRWSLCVDIDELFDYPYSDVVGLGSLLDYLNKNSYTAVTAQLLDMFPEKPLLERVDEPDEPLKEIHRFYDISNLTRWNKEEDPQMLSSRNNILGTGEVEWFRGGVRSNVFGLQPFLTKYPLVFYDGKVWPDPPHQVRNARIADFTCVLLHYKFLKHFHKQATWGARTERYWRNSVEYKKYVEVLNRNPNLRLKQESSREITNVNDLLENGFLYISDDYMVWVNAEERRSVLQPAQDKPDGLVEALLESKRQQRAKTLRIGMVERQQQKQLRRFGWQEKWIEELDRQLHNRDQRIEELDRQLHNRDQRIEEFKEKQQRLRSKVQDLRQRNQRLTQKLQNSEERLWEIQNSRIWKLLRMVGSIRAKLPRR